jgi:hypothetical protein
MAAALHPETLAAALRSVNATVPRDGSYIGAGRSASAVVGMERFELSTPCSQSRCANQAALHPDDRRARWREGRRSPYTGPPAIRPFTVRPGQPTGSHRDRRHHHVVGIGVRAAVERVATGDERQRRRTAASEELVGRKIGFRVLLAFGHRASTRRWRSSSRQHSPNPHPPRCCPSRRWRPRATPRSRRTTERARRGCSSLSRCSVLSRSWASR